LWHDLLDSPAMYSRHWGPDTEKKQAP